MPIERKEVCLADEIICSNILSMKSTRKAIIIGLENSQRRGEGRAGRRGERKGGKGRGARPRKFPGHTSQIAKRHC